MTYNACPACGLVLCWTTDRDRGRHDRKLVCVNKRCDRYRR